MHKKILLALIPVMFAFTACQQANNIISERQRTFNDAAINYKKDNLFKQIDAIRTFSRLKDPTSIRFLVDALSNSKYELRIAAIEGIYTALGADSIVYLLPRLSDNDTFVRDKAEKYVKKTAPTSVSYIISSFYTANSSLKINLIRAMGIIKDYRFLDILKNIIINEQNDVIRIEAIKAFAKYRLIKTNNILNKAFTSNSSLVKVAALDNLVFINDKEIVDSISPLLNDRDPAVITAAINAIGNNHNEYGAVVLFDLLKSQRINGKFNNDITKALSKLVSKESLPQYLIALEDEQEFIRHIALKSATLAYKTPWSKEIIETATRNDSPEIRNLAVTVLQDLDQNVGEKKLVQSLSDSDPSARINAVQILVTLPNANDYKNQIIKLLYDKNENVQIATVKAMAQIHEKWVYNEFRRLLGGQNDSLKVATIHSLSDYISNDEVIDLLISYLSANNQDLAEASIDSLVKIGAGSVRGKLIALLKSSNSDVKLKIIRIFDYMGDYASAGAIQKLIKDPDPLVKQAANETLTTLKKRKEIELANPYF